MAGRHLVCLLAADRVYLPLQSPAETVSFYLTRFTITNSYWGWQCRFCGTFPKVAFGCH